MSTADLAALAMPYVLCTTTLTLQQLLLRTVADCGAKESCVL